MTISIHTSDRNLVKARQANPLHKDLLKRAIELALAEDLGFASPLDLTSEATVGKELAVEAVIYLKEPNVCVAGLSLIGDVFRHLDKSVLVTALVEDGTYIKDAPQPLAKVSGKALAVLGAERTALNLLQRMSGITTLTHRFVERAKPHGIAILDTRKTTPGLRVFERYAVMLAGGVNHRFGLNDKILLKDNHIQITGGVTAAIQAVKKAHPGLAIEIECTDLDQVEEGLGENVDTIMLDNMAPDMVRKAVALIKGRSRVEVSGGITLENIDTYLLPGVNAISIGALTHSVKSVDLSLEVERYL
jgi:nicotinate-nucleotide pyrophosphorylase (carboxylating)